MIQVDPPIGAPISLDSPPVLSQPSPPTGAPAATEVRGSQLDEVDDVIDLRSEVPTPYGGRLADLEAMLRKW